VTTVLGDTESEEVKQSLENWKRSMGREEAEKVSRTAADNGTVLHSIIERFLKNKELFAPLKGYTIEEHNKEAFNGIKMKLRNINEIWCLETSLYSDLFEIAGRVDCIGLYKHMPSVIDFKTSRKMKSQKDIEGYKFQLAAYAMMHNDMFKTDICQGVILMSAAGGFPMEFTVDLNDYFEPLYNRIQLFYERLNSKLKIAVG
jgi:genome maintenance exonuclease 1